MPSLIPRIHADLFDFIDHDPEELGGLLEFWYQANSQALSAALTAQDELGLMINVSSFQSYEESFKKLFLVADTLILRDTRKWTQDETGFRSIPIPTDEYRPGYYDDLKDQLELLHPSPLTLLYRPNLYRASSTKTLNNGYHVAYAGWDYNSIPNEFVDWISGSGRGYMETGRAVYAPFIPPLEWELEFLKHSVDLPASFNTMACFSRKFDSISQSSLHAISALDIPFLEGMDIRTISKVKDDYRDEFSAFSRSLRTAVNKIEAAVGTEEFERKRRDIQENLVDAAVSDIEKTMSRIKRLNVTRNGAILVGLTGLNIVAYFFAAPAAGLVTGVTASIAGMVANRAQQLKEQDELKAKNGYFLWQLKQHAT